MEGDQDGQRLPGGGFEVAMTVWVAFMGQRHKPKYNKL
jgi:hypothetical protein